jgi:hydroxymethylglutaryl-CoA reductase
MTHGGSRVEGFYRMGRPGRLEALAARLGLDDDERADLATMAPLPFEAADHMIENAVGVVGLPLGVGLNFRVNGVDRIVPMAVEEPSIVAAASAAARLVRDAGGFTADADPSLMIGQVQLVDVPDPAAAVARVETAAAELMATADALQPRMVRRGGGTRAVEARWLPETASGPMLVVHLVVDVGDAMGANAVNTMAEAVGPRLEELTGGRVRLRILSNLADRRLARAAARIPVGLLATPTLDGAEVAARVEEACDFAAADPYRAATHNKGVMNGIDAVALATGQDWRGIEAGAHAYAARDGRYGPLTSWRVEAGALVGRIELPLAVGTVGGHLELNRRAALMLRVLGVESARELAGIMAAVGLGQNFAALRALVTDGIQRGHMALHARGLAVAAGAPEDAVSEVIERLIASGEVKLAKAREIVVQVKTAVQARA